MPSAVIESRCQNTMAPRPAASVNNAAAAIRSVRVVFVRGVAGPLFQTASPPPAIAAAAYGNSGTTWARPRRSIRTAAAALPTPSATMMRRSGSRSRVRRPDSARPGPNVKSHHPSRKRSGSGSHGITACSAGQAAAPTNAPAMRRNTREEGGSIEAVALKYTVPTMPDPSSAPARSLSVIIPAYNESENILATLENVTRAFEPLALPHEILVIDGGSRDDTAALITANLGRFPHVQLLKNERNMGFGWSYRRGVEAAAL